MKNIFALFFSMVLLASSDALTHGDHVHGPISETAAIAIGSGVAKALSSRDAGLDIGQLPKSWASISIDKFTIFKKGNGYYVVSAKNKSEDKTLYILMSKGGEVYDANFSGAFNGIE